MPAIISYIALFYISHLEALKLNLKGMEDADVPNLKKTFLSGLHFLIPIFVLIYMLVYLRFTASYSIFYATVSLILVNLVYLIGNLALNIFHWYVGEVSEEEELFNPINARLSNVFTAATAVLVIAALIYTIKDQSASKEFVHFASFTFVFGLSSMLILWIPGHRAIWKFFFRHFQTILLIYSISLCLGSILILLVNIMKIV